MDNNMHNLSRMSDESSSPELSDPSACHSPPTSLVVSLSPLTSPIAPSPASSNAESEDDSPPLSPKRLKRYSAADDVSRTTLTRVLSVSRRAAGEASDFEEDGRLDQLDNTNANLLLDETHLEAHHCPPLPDLGEPGVEGEVESISSDSEDEISSASDSDQDLLSSESGNRSSASSDENSSATESDSCSEDNHSFESDSYLEYLFNGSEMTSNEALLEVLKLYVDQCWSKKSLDKNIRLIKRMLPQPNDFPANGTAAIKRLEGLTTASNAVEHLYCWTCAQLLAIPAGNSCQSCGSDANLTKFYTFNVEEEIRFMFVL